MSSCKRLVLATPALVLLLSACASPTPRYRVFTPCATKTGYKDEKISATEYRISYYSARKMEYKNIEQFIQRRAGELCGERDFKLSEPQDIFNLIVFDSFAKDCSVYEFTTVAKCLPDDSPGSFQRK